MRKFQILLLCGCLSVLPTCIANGTDSAGAGASAVTGALVVRAAAATGAPLLTGVKYRAVDEKGMVFETGAVALGAGGHATFALDGPGANSARVTARYARRRRGFTLEWTIEYHGPARKWNPWTSGFHFQFGRTVTAAKTQPVTQWVRPTGSHPWEVPGDTPYPDTECQLREVFFGDDVLVIVASRYDPDWIYQGHVPRAGFSRFALPSETPCSITTRVTFLAAKLADLDPHALAAEAAGRPVALTVTTGRPANLFEPGEPVPVHFRVVNVRNSKLHCTVSSKAWNYAGERVLTLNQPVILPPNARGTITRRFQPQQRGIVFVAARLTWPGGERIERTTVGILPERKARGLHPDSPFGLAAVIANPSRYPDQFDLDTVLGLAERIGVHWLRRGWYPMEPRVLPDEERGVRERLAILRRHGMLAHVQLGTRVPKPKDVQVLRQRFEATLRRFSGVSPYIEVGNELNLSGPGKDASVYVDRVLRPVSEIMRRIDPEGHVMSMGFGGVHKKWLDAFIADGGMDLIDVLSVHPGCHPRAPEFWKGWRGWVFRSQMLDAMKAAREHGSKDVWITEAYAPTPPGRSGLDVRTSANYLVRLYVCSLALGVKVIEFYQFQDGVWYARREQPDDVEYNFGIVYSDLTPKPAYIAYGTMTEQLEGAVYRGRLDLGAGDLYGVRFIKNGRSLDVLWSYREKHEVDVAWYPPDKFKGISRKPMEPWLNRWHVPVAVSLPASKPVMVTDLMGNPRKVEPNRGKVTLELTGSPIYVRGLGDVPLAAQFWPDID